MDNIYFMKTLFYPLIAFYIIMLSSCLSLSREDNIEIQNFNTVRIFNNMEETNHVDPESNRIILPYILDQDRFDLLSGGIVYDLRELIPDYFGMDRIVEDLTDRGFAPTVLVYYSNDTKNTDNFCVYQGRDLIYFSRYAYNYIPITSLAESQ